MVELKHFSSISKRFLGPRTGHFHESEFFKLDVSFEVSRLNGCTAPSPKIYIVIRF